jgi:hypothetical protein
MMYARKEEIKQNLVEKSERKRTFGRPNNNELGYY